LLYDRETDAWEVSTNGFVGGSGLEMVDTLDGLFNGIVSGQCLRVAQLVLRVFGNHEVAFKLPNTHCHRVGDVYSDDKSKRVLWVWSYLVRQVPQSKVDMAMKVLLQNWKGDTRQEFEDMEEFSLGAVASVGELHWKLCGEPNWRHGKWVGSMEWGSTQEWLERGWDTKVADWAQGVASSSCVVGGGAAGGGTGWWSLVSTLNLNPLVSRRCTSRGQPREIQAAGWGS
jgi:hypothetical protein